jgi:FtsZ-interacting cell division protein ZipA
MMEIIVGAVVAIAAVFAAYWKGKSTERQSTDLKAAQNRAETIERVENANTGESDDDSTVLERLRSRRK